MSLKAKHLTKGETVVLDLHTHAKALFWPVVLLVVLVAALVAALGFLPAGVPRDAAAVLALLMALAWVLPSFVRWRSTSYVVTNKRVLVRSGIFVKVGRDIPLFRINDVSTEKGLLDRLFGCGTIVIADASEKPGLVLRDVPDVEDVQVTIHDLLFAADDGSDSGEFPPPEAHRRTRGR